MLFLLSADVQGLGRFEASMLTDQQAIELFFAPTDYDEARKALGGEEADACTWQDVTCNDKRRIVRIDWHQSFIELSGSMDFSMLPRCLEYLNLYKEDFVGEVHATALPETLIFFCIECCKFTGTLDLSSLPPRIDQLIIRDNYVSALVFPQGTNRLPSKLKALYIKERHILNLPIRIGLLPEGDIDVELGYMSTADVLCESLEDKWRIEIVEY